MKKMLLAVAALMLAVASDAQINLNKLQKAAQGVMKQQNSSNNKSNSNSSKSTWTCDKCNHSGNTGNFCAECGAKQMTAQEKQAAEQSARNQAEAEQNAAAAAQIKLIEAEEARIDALHFNQKNDPAFSRTSREATWEFIKKSPIQYPRTQFSQGWDYYRAEGTFGLFEYWDDYLMPKSFPKKPENIALRELQMNYRPYDETAMLSENRQYGLYAIDRNTPHCVYYNMDCYASIELMDYLLTELEKNGFAPTRRPDKYGREEMDKGYDYKWMMYGNDYFAYMTCRKSLGHDGEYSYELAFVPHNKESVDVFDGVPMPVEGYPTGKLEAGVCHNTQADYWEFDPDDSFDGTNKKPGTHWELRDYVFPCFSLNGFNKYCARLEKAGFTKKSAYNEDEKFCRHATFVKGNYTVSLTLDRDKHILTLNACDFALLTEGW